MLHNNDVEVVVETVTVDQLSAGDKLRYNTNNLYKGEQPADYRDVCDATRTETWIDQFKTYQAFTLDLTSPITSWMIDACKMGIHTGKFPKSYEDERDLVAATVTAQHPDIFNGTEYFIRTESVSLKYGQHKAGPYTDMKHIIESLVTSIDGHTPIHDNTAEIKLYFIPWEKLTLNREYRGFVCNNQLTAISQQHLYNILQYDNPEREAKLIYDYFHTVMRAKITFLENYSFDIALLEDDTPYFIEMNCFGTEYAAGSALYGWEQDHDILYGTHKNKLYFRYTVA